MGTLHEDLCTLMTVSHCILLRMRSVSDKSRENQNTRFVFNNFFPEYPAGFEKMWKNMVEPDGLQMAV